MKPPFYRAFEDRYRGSRATVLQRLRAYLPFLQPLARNVDGVRARAIDLGCGRGEWLELLTDQGFDAHGVDLDDGMLAACRERGLQVRHLDALQALRALPDASVALVSAFHLVEHIPFDMVRELIDQALRVLRPGGLLIMETPNPENLVVGASDFYLDPTHLRPVPPKLLAFAVEHAGFARHAVVRLQEDAQLREGGRVALGAVLEGASPDYSVIAQQGAEQAKLAPFDAAFGAAYGIDLKQLALRFEQQRSAEHAEIHQICGQMGERGDTLARAFERSEQARSKAEAQRLTTQHELDARLGRTHQQLGQTEHRLGLTEQHLGQTEHRLGLSELRLAQTQEQLAHTQQLLDQSAAKLARCSDVLGATGERIAHAERRIDQTEARLNQAQQVAERQAQQLIEVYQSTSWRVTAPLRAVGAAPRRARQLAGRARNGAKRRAAALIRRLAGAVLRRPLLKRVARRVLAWFPSLQRRTRVLLFRLNAASQVDHVHGGAAEPPAKDTDDLAPRVAKVYQALKKAQRDAQRTHS